MTLIGRFIITLLLSSTLLITYSCVSRKAPIPIIFDTDFGGDADDLGALAMLNHFHSKGEIDLLGIGCFNTEKYAVSAIDAVNTYYKHPEIPVGLRNGDPHENPWNHSKVIADNLEHDLTIENIPGAVQVYRKLLSEAEEKSIKIICVGPMKNIHDLISSPPDSISPLTGKQLLHTKIKEMIIMGGRFPSGEYEWNFDGGMPGITKSVLENIELPITFLGAEMGDVIKTGEVFNTLPEHSPLHLGFYHFSKYAPWVKDNFQGKINDNATFDQTAVLYAVRGGEGYYWDRESEGACIADSTGGNYWQSEEVSNHSYLKLKMPIPQIEKEIEEFMLGNF